MDNILKDLYFGRYAAFERKIEPSSSHAEAIDKVVELEEALMNDLPSELLQRFRTYSNAVTDLASITAACISFHRVLLHSSSQFSAKRENSAEAIREYYPDPQNYH